jgi:hypothetical protein
MARWALTVRRVRFLATSCRAALVLLALKRSGPAPVNLRRHRGGRSSRLGKSGECNGSIVPQRYPCGAVGGRGRSMRCGEGSFVAGTATPTCRSGIGTPCCRHGRRFYPVRQDPVSNRASIVSASVVIEELFSLPSSTPPCNHLELSLRPNVVPRRGTVGKSYLAGVNSLARESIVVGTHLVASGGCMATRLFGVVDRGFGVGKSWSGRDTFNFSELEVCGTD